MRPRTVSAEYKRVVTIDYQGHHFGSSVTLDLDEGDSVDAASAEANRIVRTNVIDAINVEMKEDSVFKSLFKQYRNKVLKRIQRIIDRESKQGGYE